MSGGRAEDDLVQRLEEASPPGLGEAFENVLQKASRNSWLPHSNRYKTDASNQLKEDEKNGRITRTDLVEYIAASGPLHATDGWAYLGRALDAHLRRDSGAALHLAYYAELRAAMGLLATQGIGIFNGLLCVVKGPNECELHKGGGTHKLSWTTLQAWSRTFGAADVLVTTIRPLGRDLKDYIDIFSSSSATVSTIATEWLESWGLDLKLVAEDQPRRNLASYHPTAFETRGSSTVKEEISFALDFWRLLEPTPSARFGELDRYLLRNSLERLFSSEKESSIRQASQQYAKRVDAMIDELSPSCPHDAQFKQLKEFLKAAKEEQPILMTEALRGNEPFPWGVDAPVIARAALLLRLATGCCEHLFSAAGVEVLASVQDWWQQIGARRGLWKPQHPPDSLCDLWVDIEGAVESLGGWLDSYGTGECSLYSLAESCTRDLHVLGSCERVGLWGLGL